MVSGLSGISRIAAITAYAADTKDMQWVKYGISMYKSGQYEKAVLAYEKAIEINPDNAYAYQYMGMAYLALKDNDMADEYFQRAYDLRPTPALKKQIQALDEKVFGEGKYFLYPVTFELYIGTGIDLGTFTDTAIDSGGNYNPFSNILRYGGMVSYHFCNWFDVRSGMIIGWGADIPVLARFSFKSPWNSNSIVGIAAGPYVNAGAPVNLGTDMGVVFSGDWRYVFGSMAIVGTDMIEIGLAKATRFAELALIGVAF